MGKVWTRSVMASSRTGSASKEVRETAPVMHSQSRTPKLYASTASVSRAPSNISGAMYAGVPAWLLRVLMYVLWQRQHMQTRWVTAMTFATQRG